MDGQAMTAYLLSNTPVKKSAGSALSAGATEDALTPEEEQAYRTISKNWAIWNNRLIRPQEGQFSITLDRRSHPPVGIASVLFLLFERQTIRHEVRLRVLLHHQVRRTSSGCFRVPTAYHLRSTGWLLQEAQILAPNNRAALCTLKIGRGHTSAAER